MKWEQGGRLSVVVANGFGQRFRNSDKRFQNYKTGFVE